MARRLVVAPHDEGQAELAAAIAEFADDPLGFVLFCYPWGEPGGPLAEDEPDVWQVKFLKRLAEAISEHRERESARLPCRPIQFATVSGNGVGKTALVAWLIHWFMSTRHNAQIVVTANTRDQLTGKTWRELAKWQKMAINGDWFQWTATRYYLKGRQDTWFAAAVPWSKERAEAFQGAHDENIMLIFDEASGIDDSIFEAGDGCMTTHGAMWFVFGNGNRNTGRFRECFRRFAHRWVGFKVDSRNAKKANSAKIAEWIQDYGEDSDFVRVRVKGEFPRAASTQFISTELVEQAVERFKRRVQQTSAHFGRNTPRAPVSGDPIIPFRDMDWGDNPLAPMILSLDVGRFNGDCSVLGARKGYMFRILKRWQDQDGPAVANAVAAYIDEIAPDAVVVDAVGVGASVADHLKFMGYDVIFANAGLTALDSQTFFNRRAEMYDKVREWLKQGGMIPPEETLVADLVALEYGFDAKQRIQLERKEDMRDRLGRSPDDADCLSLSFFQHFAPREPPGGGFRSRLRHLALAGGSWMSR